MMSTFLRRAAGIASLVLVTATTASVSAQTSPEANAEARMSWAKRRVELVCRPLQEQGRKAEAAKCFQSVSLFIADPNSPMPEDNATRLRRTAEPAAAPLPVVPPHRPVVRTANRTRVATAAKPRHAAIRHRVAHAAAPKPARRLVVASADQDAAPAMRDAAPSPRRYSRIMTILGVGY